MHLPKSLRRTTIAAALLCAALSSTALTLGRSRGVALIGRPLDFTIAVTLDAPADEAGLCAEADVFQGDTRVDTARVAVRLEPGTGREALLRVRSAVAVDEPVVTVYLRLGCQQKVTRRYVLLAEPPGDLPVAGETASAAAIAAPVARVSNAAQAGPPQAQVLRPGGNRVTSSRRAAAAAAAVETAKPPAAPAEARLRALPPQRRATARDKPVGGARPRLEVSMLDLSPEGEARLKASVGLAGEPTATPQQRAEAAALWRALQAEPADVLRDAQRLQTMETDVKGLRELFRNTNKSLAELRADLDKARAERTVAFIAFAVVLLLIAAGAVAWRLRRAVGTRGPYRDWWRRQENFAGDTGLGDDSAPHGSRPASRSGLDVDLDLDESMFDSLKQAPAKPVRPTRETQDSMRSDHPEFAHSMPSGLRMVKAEELVDIQQQAEFFMSLGQVEQAIEVLTSHIHNNVETSALVWLDLLDIYQQAKRREDYDALRLDFQRVFNAQVPEFDAPRSVSVGLEGYPRALSRIAALWPSPKVLEIIEESIFRKPGMADGEPFDLEAYRELVTLYNVGKEILQGEPAGEDWTSSHPPGTGFSNTNIHPLTDPLEFTSASPASSDSELPWASPRLGLDIDLTVEPPPAEKDAPPSLNMVDFDLFDAATQGDLPKIKK